MFLQSESTLFRKAPVLPHSSKRFIEETCWRNPACKWRYQAWKYLSKATVLIDIYIGEGGEEVSFCISVQINMFQPRIANEHMLTTIVDWWEGYTWHQPTKSDKESSHKRNSLGWDNQKEAFSIPEGICSRDSQSHQNTGLFKSFNTEPMFWIRANHNSFPTGAKRAEDGSSCCERIVRLANYICC
jgi:hypothetical protein